MKENNRKQDIHRGPGRFETIKPKNTKPTLKRLASYFKSEIGGLTVVVIMIITATLLKILSPYLIGVAIDKYIIPKNFDGLAKLSLFLFITYIFASIITWMQSYIMVSISQRSIMKIRKELFEKIQLLPISYFDKHPKGDIMSRMTNDIENISNTLSNSVIRFLNSLLSVSGTIIAMFALNWQLAGVTVLTLPLIMVVIGSVAKYTKKHFKEQQKYLGNINSIIEETITGQKVIKSFVKENSKIDEFNKENRTLRESSINAQIFSGLMGPLMNLINNIRFAIIVGAGALLTLFGYATVGIIASFINYSRQFGHPLSELAQLYNTIQAAIAGAERVFEVLDEKSEFEDEKTCKKIDRVGGEVIFENVDFSYEKDIKVLKDISFQANPGDTIALVGPTGAGKTTIINLITRFYEIDNGAIIVDNENIINTDKQCLRKRLGIVLQDTYLFSGTVKENIRFGNLEANDDEIINASKMANAHHFILTLPNGYDTILSEDGHNLSQGQRQLLAIARAILANHDILILDEATSSVDTRTEAQIQEALLKLMEGKTSFIIAHRLSTIKEADKIMVINNGEIEEMGNHNELIEKQGFYCNMYKSQFKSKI